MLCERDRELARQFRSRVSAIVAVVDLWVFGSRARVEAADDSDLDLFLVVDQCAPELRTRVSEIAWEVGFEADTLLSTTVASRQQLEQGPLAASPLLRNVRTEGVRV